MRGYLNCLPCSPLRALKGLNVVKFMKTNGTLQALNKNELITVDEKEAMDLKDSRDGYVRGCKGRNIAIKIQSQK